ncbi:unnamed protein product [Notodromas monacha]|uniref:glutaminase n=1 Tax=Notodromas monacha TaxID=399045 RepID=A0A7R9BGQ4_9CRUS|nr:unnamed protein product [Notodromas monacha]CAG0913555.1 unnamed protein product [Notodromas monacha]
MRRLAQELCRAVRRPRAPSVASARKLHTALPNRRSSADGDDETDKRSIHNQKRNPYASSRGERNAALAAQFFSNATDTGVAKPSIYMDLPMLPNLETIIFDAFKTADDKVKMITIFDAIKATGLQMTDPRLRQFLERLEEVRMSTNRESIKSLVLDKDQFCKVLDGSLVLLSRALRNQFRIPDFPDLRTTIEKIFWECRNVEDGFPASYIPQLAKMDKDYWGVSLCTIDGQRHHIGDSEINFTIQSCSKPLTYGLALNEVGRTAVHKYVGKEPSGRMFNSLTLDYNSKPHNPMINSGAIVVCGVILALVHPEMDSATKFDFVCQYLKAMAGNDPIGFNNSVFLSEKSSGNRNFAIAFHLMDNHCFPEKVKVKDVLDFYFQLCSFEVNCQSLAVIAGTLANGGVCPTTGEKVLEAEAVRDVLTLMHSCGMYDYSGEFAFFVGLPAKSGVSGATMVVVPNVMGLATFAPPLDPMGNSYKGLKFCKELVNVYNFHRFDDLLQTQPSRAGSKDPRKHKYDSLGLRIVNLLFAAAAGDISAIRRHFLSGIDVNLQDYDGRSALHLAACEGHVELVKFLVDCCKADVTLKDRWGNSALDDAQSFGRTEVVSLLKERLRPEGTES